MGILSSVYIYLSIGLSPSTAHTLAIKSTARHDPLNPIFNNHQALGSFSWMAQGDAEVERAELQE